MEIHIVTTKTKNGKTVDGATSAFTKLKKAYDYCEKLRQYNTITTIQTVTLEKEGYK